MAKRGFVLIHKRIQDSPCWLNDGAFKTFVAILLRAAWRPMSTAIRVGRTTCKVELQAGETVIRSRLFAQDLGTDPKTLRRRLAMLETWGCITVSATDRFTRIRVINWANYQPRPKHGEGLDTAATRDGEGLDTAQSPSPSPPHKNKKKTKGNNERARARFVKPTVDEVREYAVTIGFAIDAEKFIAHYESNGWKVGRNPMRSWKAAVTTWKKRENDFKGNENEKTKLQSGTRHDHTRPLKSDDMRTRSGG